MAASAGQMGPSWWTAHHRHHHRHVDTAADPHTPLVPSVGWLLSPTFHPQSLPADVEGDPVLRLIDRLHVVCRPWSWPGSPGGWEGRNGWGPTA